MNTRKGFFRLTLVLSILIGAITLFRYNEWIFTKNAIKVDLPDDWETRSEQVKLNSIDSLLSNKATFFLLPKIVQLNIKRELKETIISHIKTAPDPEDIEWDTTGDPKKKVDLSFLSDQPEILHCYFLSLKLGWRELSLLTFVGFAPVWIIYAFIRWVVIAFIVRGFKAKS